MSEEIKYEAVFGDQSLFDGAPDDAIIAVEHGRNEISYFSEHYKSASVIFTTSTSIAMRRIIKTPVWTVADRNAGRKPEVGSIGTLSNGVRCEWLGLSDCCGLAHVRMTGGLCARIEINDFKPIETPEERAQRLEDEHLNMVAKKYPEFDIPTARAIYRLYLSGELQAPTKGE